ncbi:GtrA family protein [Patescibacteria group bacterium]|nr:GtrA family protein [Patescibacteria group bacterium]
MNNEVVTKTSQQFMKFAIVGVGNTAIDIGLLNLLIYWSWPILLANTVAFIFAATNSFFLNKYWTFGDKEGKWHIQLPFYITIAVVGLGISNLFVYVGSIIWHWDINVVKIISIGAIFLWNFLAPKFLIFKK